MDTSALSAEGLLRIVNKEQGWIGFRLNLLGVRVFRDGCILAAKTGPSEWKSIGPKKSFPVNVPQDADALKAAGDDALLGTAFQYMAANPNSDLADLLSSRKDFDVALNEATSRGA